MISVDQCLTLSLFREKYANVLAFIMYDLMNCGNNEIKSTSTKCTVIILETDKKHVGY